MKDFKEKTEVTKQMGTMMDPGFEAAQGELRKEEKKLGVSEKHGLLFLTIILALNFVHLTYFFFYYCRTL